MSKSNLAAKICKDFNESLSKLDWCLPEPKHTNHSGNILVFQSFDNFSTPRSLRGVKLAVTVTPDGQAIVGLTYSEFTKKLNELSRDLKNLKESTTLCNTVVDSLKRKYRTILV